MQTINITEEETKLANDEAIMIFGYLRKKYCNENIRDLDIVLNSLSFALLHLIMHHVPPGGRHTMIKTINHILENGIKTEDKK